VLATDTVDSVKLTPFVQLSSPLQLLKLVAAETELNAIWIFWRIRGPAKDAKVRARDYGKRLREKNRRDFHARASGSRKCARGWAASSAFTRNVGGGLTSIAAANGSNAPRDGQAASRC